MVVVNEEEFRRLPGSIAMYRAGIALAQGDLPEAMAHARRVFDRSPQEDHRTRGAAAALLGLAYWTDGDLEDAHRSFAEGMAQLQMAGNIADAVGGVLALDARCMRTRSARQRGRSDKGR
jgi:LuxR family maltose regulon positive regulatory protein